MATRDMTSMATEPARTQVKLRKDVAAWCMPASIALLMISNSVYAVLNYDGLNEETGADMLELYLRGPSLWTFSAVCGLFAVLLLVPGVLAVVRSVRLEKPRMAQIAGILMIAGYISYFGILFASIARDELMRFAPETMVEFTDQATISPVVAPFFLLFVVGNLLGTLLLGLVVVLNSTVPRWAGYLLMGWTVGHIINITVSNEWFAVAGGAVELIGFIVIARAITKLSDEEWILRG